MEALQKLGIDGWALMLYFVNFGVVIFLMQRYLYGPLIKFIDERRATITRNIEEAEELRKSFEAEAKKQLANTDAKTAEMNERIAEAKKHAKDEAKALITDADARRSALLADAQEQADAMKDGILKDAEAETLKRIESVIKHILQNDVPANIIEDSVKKGWNKA